jgi:hypothetical protein
MNGITVGQDGLSKLNAKILRECMLVEEHTLPDGSVIRKAAIVQKQLNCWLKVLVAQHPLLAKIAAVYLHMHSLSCASERNLSVFGRLYDKFRSRLQLTPGEMIVYLAVNARIQNGALDTSKEEVLFNDSDIEEENEVLHTVLVEVIDEGDGDGSPIEIQWLKGLLEGWMNTSRLKSIPFSTEEECALLSLSHRCAVRASDADIANA